MDKIISFLFLLTAYCIASAHEITPCASDDSACLAIISKEALQQYGGGSPELGIESVDPMYIALIESNKKGLELVFKNTTITGVKNCEVKDLANDASNKKQYVTLKCSVILNGWYKLGGKLLVVPVQGEGTYKVTLDDIEIKVTLYVNTITGKDGQPHWDVTKFDHTYKVLTRATFRFDHLFNGNEQLSDSAHEFANSNWQDVMTEVAPEIVTAVATRVIKHIGSVYRVISIDKVIKS